MKRFKQKFISSLLTEKSLPSEYVTVDNFIKKLSAVESTEIYETMAILCALLNGKITKIGVKEQKRR